MLIVSPLGLLHLLKLLTFRTMIVTNLQSPISNRLCGDVTVVNCDEVKYSFIDHCKTLI